MMATRDIYATPRKVTDVGDCFFYHTMDIPGYGCVEGEWDLRPTIQKYLGGVDFGGKRVLDVGAASGLLSFHMEKEGAEVVSFDVSEEYEWDVIPFARYDHTQISLDTKDIRRKLNNGYWLAHGAFNSNAKAVHGSVYGIPEEIGPVDISVFGSILLHLRDPFLALHNALRLTGEKVVITDCLWPGGGLRGHRRLRRFDRACRLLERSSGYSGFWLSKFAALEKRIFFTPQLIFLPEFNVCFPNDCMTWWYLSPEVCAKFIRVLGFERCELKYHYQLSNGSQVPLYTLIGYRTQDMH